jgi:hypothetical protein
MITCLLCLAMLVDIGFHPAEQQTAASCGIVDVCMHQAVCSVRMVLNWHMRQAVPATAAATEFW